MTLKRIDFKTIYKSLIWITVLLILSSGFSIYCYGEGALKSAKSNITDWYTWLRILVIIPSALISSNLVFYLNLKNKKKTHLLRRNFIFSTISILINLILFGGIFSYLVSDVSVLSVKDLSKFLYLEIAFWLITFYVFINITGDQEEVKIKELVKKNTASVILILSSVILVFTVLNFKNLNVVNSEILYLFAALAIALYTAVFLPAQIINLILKFDNTDKDESRI